MVRNPIRGEQLSLRIVLPDLPQVNPSPGEQITTRSGQAIVTQTEQAGRERIIWADYGSGIAQPHALESLLPPAPFPPEPFPESVPRPRRHSPKGQASGWIEERVGNRQRKTPSLSYYYRWQDCSGRYSRYIPVGRLWRVRQMVEREGRPIAEVLTVLGCAGDGVAYYQANPSAEVIRMNVELTVELFDQIERYLEERAAQQDGAAARLLQALEVAELERTAQVYGITEQDRTNR